MFRDIPFSRKTPKSKPGVESFWTFFSPAFERIFYTVSIANFSNLVNLHESVLMHAKNIVLNSLMFFGTVGGKNTCKKRGNS
jgi:hypothetical protein